MCCLQVKNQQVPSLNGQLRANHGLSIPTASRSRQALRSGKRLCTPSVKVKISILPSCSVSNAWYLSDLLGLLAT